MLDLSAYDVPSQNDRTENDADDIETAWKIVKASPQGHLLDSTEGHLAVLRALRCGRMGDYL